MNIELKNKIEELIKKNKPDLESESISLITVIILESIDNEDIDFINENLENFVLAFLDSAYGDVNIQNLIEYEETKKDLLKTYKKEILKTNSAVNYLRLAIIFSIYIKIIKLREIELHLKIYNYDVDEMFNDLYSNLYKTIDNLKSDKLIFKNIRKYLSILKKYNNMNGIFQIYDTINKLKHKYIDTNEYVNMKINGVINIINGITFISSNHLSEQITNYNNSINDDCKKLGLK